MATCHCDRRHTRRRIVVTGGPGAGKTAAIELARRAFCTHVEVLPETAGILYGGGFPRSSDPARQRTAQRAIFFVQRELEASADVLEPAVVICDRGTVDAGAYWPGPGELWSSVGTTLDEQCARYDVVIHMRTPSLTNGYDHSNPLRQESASDASLIDQRIGELWSRHSRLYSIDATPNFLEKVEQVMTIIAKELPECCVTGTEIASDE